MQGIITVEKENLTHLRFIKEDVLRDENSRKTRLYLLQKALALGNLYHQKVNIIYLLRDGQIQQVETTVWAVGEEYVVLKGGVTIPVHAILEIEF